jgi:enterochelin esterase-like enzyme
MIEHLNDLKRSGYPPTNSGCSERKGEKRFINRSSDAFGFPQTIKRSKSSSTVKKETTMFKFTRQSRVYVWSLISVFIVVALFVSLAPTVPVRAQVQVVSPEVGPNGWVTFRYYDPTATLVQLYGEWGRNDLGAMCYSATGWPVLDMTMDGDGVWSYTIQLEPNFYNYRFIVWHDTIQTPVTDPSNPAWHPEAINSQVYVPGPEYEWVSVQDVPHGQLWEEFYWSDATQSMRPYAVYLPPNYDKDNRKFPTLYLSHGAWGNHIDWSTQGLANNILDNLIAEHKIRPMVVVMTNFNDIPGGAGGYRLDLINSVVPDVEAKFRVNRNPEQRAFAGLSMGGIYAADILVSSPWEFGFIGIWSGGGVTNENLQPNLAAIREMRGIDVSVGGRDFLYNYSLATMAALDANSIPYTGLVTPGDCHTWYFWRDALYHFLTGPLFKVN